MKKTFFILLAMMLSFSLNAEELTFSQQDKLKKANQLLTRAQKNTSNSFILKRIKKHLDQLVKEAPDHPQVKELQKQYLQVEKVHTAEALLKKMRGPLDATKRILKAKKIPAWQHKRLKKNLAILEECSTKLQELKLDKYKKQTADAKATVDQLKERLGLNPKKEEKEEDKKAESDTKEEDKKAESDAKEEDKKAESDAKEEDKKDEADAKEEDKKAEADAKEEDKKAESDVKEEDKKAEADAKEEGSN
ncbi:hypothetical protein [Candidatus Uabimicrobium amorphum]|uniref:hypothetical protein n=1 Tax=Uabimicrobium amorphum TaxID=2596890 RepID=UPI0034A1161B